MNRIPTILLLLLLTSIPGHSAGNKLKITLKDALSIAINNNIQTRIAALSLRKARNDVKKENRQYRIAPYLSGDFDASGPDSDIITGTIAAGITKKFRFGADLTLAIQSSIYGNQTDTYGSNPSWKSGVTLSLSQPLLRMAGASYLKYGYKTAKLTVRQKELAFTAEISKLIRDTELAYWRLLYAQRGLIISRISLKLAKQLLEMNRIRVKVGLQAATDLIEARSVVAQRKEEQLRAENNVKSARDTLLSLLRPGKLRESITAVQILSKPIQKWSPPVKKNLFRMAVTRNSDYLIAAINLKKNRLDSRYYKNLMRPDLDLDIGLSFKGRDSRLSRSFSDAGKPDDYSISFGFKLTLPWDSDARDNYKNTVLDRRILSLTLQKNRRDLKDRISTALRNINNAASRILAAKDARDLSRQRLELVTKKFNLKLSSNTDVLQSQKDYLESILSYEKSVLEHNEARVQLLYECGINLDSHKIIIRKTK